MVSEIDDINTRWENLLNRLTQTIGKRPVDLNSILFLIGIQELGQGTKNFSKEQKQDLIHIAICKILSRDGIYESEGRDEQGWPHWKLVKKLPYLDILNQENLLKTYILAYFEEEIF